eukprot:scaffold125840_cov32-Tisochrysis_lutea.AAC.3
MASYSQRPCHLLQDLMNPAHGGRHVPYRCRPPNPWTLSPPPCQTCEQTCSCRPRAAQPSRSLAYSAARARICRRARSVPLR